MAGRLSDLRHFIANQYDEEGLHTLCFDLAVPSGELGGGRVSDQARELLLYLGQRRRLETLLRQLRATRPAAFNAAGFSLDQAAVAELYARLPAFAADPGRPQVDLVAEAQKRLEAMPIDQPVAPGDLPPGSRLPLARNPLFTGREEALQQLAAVVKAGGTVAMHQAAAITGLGGVGKSQLATEFVYRYGRYFAGGVYWLSLADPAGVPAEVVTCGAAMGLPLDGLDLARQVAAVRRAWQEPLPRLLVFDNCEDEALLAEWRPTSGGGRVLVTSRRGRWDAALGVAVLALDVLPRPESVALLQNLAGFRGYASYPNLRGLEAEAIAAELGDFPLALSLAGSFLARYRTVTPAAYLAQLRDQTLLDHPSLQGRGSGHSPTGHEQHVGRTFALSYDKLDPAGETDRAALALLARAACFAPGLPIPHDLLVATLEQDGEVTESKSAFGRIANVLLQAVSPGRQRKQKVQEDDKLLVEDGLARLVELGLVEGEAGGGARLHPLVAAFVRQALAEAMGEAAGAVAEAVVQAASTINQAGYPRPLLAWQEHLRYVAGVAAERADERAGWLWNELGYHLDLAGDYGGARTAYERALAIDEATFGPDHPNVARDANNLGSVLDDMGDYSGARTAYERALAIDEATFGPDHPNVARDVNNLGSVLSDMGDYSGARAAYERALAIDQAALGPDHPKVATRVNNLGLVLRALGDEAGARAAFERALAVDEAVFGPNHPKVATDVSNLGLTLRAQGDPAGAQAAFERALAIDEAVFGPNHPKVATDVNNLGSALLDLGDLARARVAYERALTIDEAAFGPNHPKVATDVNNLGGALQDLGDLAGARAAFERALAIDQAALGPNHPNVASDVNNLGGALEELGDPAGARAAFEQALAIWERALGPDHPSTQIARRNLAGLEE